ncbi:MAG: hypothetical protein M3Y59_01800, partial [Myxococcota bacterium]|nr:hypothetical protein [Myxococcota bacterium]
PRRSWVGLALGALLLAGVGLVVGLRSPTVVPAPGAASPLLSEEDAQAPTPAAEVAVPSPVAPPSAPQQAPAPTAVAASKEAPAPTAVAAPPAPVSPGPDVPVRSAEGTLSAGSTRPAASRPSRKSSREVQLLRRIDALDSELATRPRHPGIVTSARSLLGAARGQVETAREDADFARITQGLEVWEGRFLAPR